MKKFGVTGLVLMLGLAFGSGASAADSAKNRAEFTLDGQHFDTKQLIGMKVVTPDGKHVGEIDHFIVNTSDGKVSHAIVGLGGLAGIGERHVVVPWSQVRLNRDPKDPADRKDMMATIDRSVLDSAPKYTRTARDDHRAPAASPATAPNADRDRDGVRNKDDRAPNNPRKY